MPAPSKSSQPSSEPDSRWWDVALLRHPQVLSGNTPDALVFSALGFIYAVALILAERWQPIPAADMLLLTAVGLILLTLSWIDLRIRHLPNVLVAAVFLCGVAAVLVQGVIPQLALMPALGQGSVGLALNAAGGMLVGGGLLWLMGALVSRFSGRPALGMGDVKLVGALSLLTGLSGLPMLLLVASWSALPLAVYLMLTGRRGHMIPFGPFLCLGGWITLLYQNMFWQVLATGGL